MKSKIIKKTSEIDCQTQDGKLSNHLKEKFLERREELKERLLEIEYLIKKVEV